MNARTITGLLLLLLGAFMFLNRGGSFGPGAMFAYFWPSLFVIPAGLFFHWMYFSMTGRRGVGLLVPGGILLASGIVCQWAMLFGGWGYVWPGFILAVAFGLFELYWFGGRNKWLLIPINILVVLGLLFAAVFTFGALADHVAGQPLVAIALAAAGALLLLRKRGGV